MKRVFNIKIESDFEINDAIQASVQAEVQASIQRQVDESVKTAIDAAVRSEVDTFVHNALRTKVKIFDYDGKVKEERSFEQAIKAALVEINKQGVAFKIKTGSFSSDNRTVADVIKDDLYAMMSKKLKPFFDKMEAEFQEKSQAKLREFALAAIDNSNKKVLRGY